VKLKGEKTEENCDKNGMKRKRTEEMATRGNEGRETEENGDKG
jgi:hypothetical protein